MYTTDAAGLNMSDKPQWKPLRVFNLYRIIIAGLLLALVLTGGPRFLGEYNPDLFIAVSTVYILISLTLIVASFYQWPSYTIQVVVQAIADVLAITLLMHASGGTTSGLGMLMIVSVAGASLLLPGRAALLFAAFGALALLLEEIYAHLNQSFATTAYTQTGMLGATLFATALLSITLARKAKQSEELATQRGVDLANMVQLNAQIVNRMSSGIIVVDDDAHVRLMNQPARKLLSQSVVITPKSLQELSAPLHRAFIDWQSNHAQDLANKKPDLNCIKGLQVRITRVGARKEDQGSIIYLEDAAEINRHIQETKLASLGRLTASIAHEIRNPLGAISHAAQLLDESPELNRPDKRLVGIINDHSNRMNEIIQNILQLSRKEQPKQELLPLQSWLERFIAELNRSENLPADWIQVHLVQPQLMVFMDPNHLHQVLWNLCVNARKYGTSPGTEPKLLLQGGISKESGSPYLDVIDFGPGIDASVQSQLFEPFFTTHSSGTGLGLYISRQLCERNDGDLIFISRSNYGSCFRIQFPIHYAEDKKVATRAYR